MRSEKSATADRVRRPWHWAAAREFAEHTNLSILAGCYIFCHEDHEDTKPRRKLLTVVFFVIFVIFVIFVVFVVAFLAGAITVAASC